MSPCFLLTDPGRDCGISLGTDVFGNIQRLDNLLNNFEYQLKSAQNVTPSTTIGEKPSLLGWVFASRMAICSCALLISALAMVIRRGKCLMMLSSSQVSVTAA